MHKQTVNFAVAGCGNIGRRHVAVLDAEARASIAALCDIEVDKARELAEQYELNVPIFQNYEDMLEAGEFDVVSICTPHRLHAPMAIAAAERKRHILVEKPMALSSNEALQMIESAKRNDVMLVVVKQNRFNVPVQMVNELIRTNRFGRIFMVQCNVLWNRTDWYYQQSAWRGKKDEEGGALYTQASHFIDLLIWWFGDVVNATGVVDRKNHEIEIEDCGSATLEFSTGTLGALVWTTCVYSKNYEGSITIIGEKGTVKIGGPYLNKIEFWNVEGYPLPENVEFVDKPNIYSRYQGSSSNHDKVIHNVIAKLLGEEHSVVDGYEGLKTIQAIERIYAGVRYQNAE